MPSLNYILGHGSGKEIVAALEARASEPHNGTVQCGACGNIFVTVHYQIQPGLALTFEPHPDVEDNCPTRPSVYNHGPRAQQVEICETCSRRTDIIVMRPWTDDESTLRIAKGQ